METGDSTDASIPQEAHSRKHKIEVALGQMMDDTPEDRRGALTELVKEIMEFVEQDKEHHLQCPRENDVMCLEQLFFFTQILQNDNMSRSIAAASTVSRRPNKEIFQDENCINYSNCLKEYLDRLLVALTDKVKDGTLSYKQGVDIMYHWDDAVYEGEVKDFVRREPNIELLHRYTFLKFYQFGPQAGLGDVVPGVFADLRPGVRVEARDPGGILQDGSLSTGRC